MGRIKVHLIRIWRVLYSSQTSALGSPGEGAGRRARVGIASNLAGGVLMQGGTLLTSVVLARILGKYDFGRFAMIQSTMVALTALTGLGLGITAIKYVSQYRKAQPERAGRIMGLSSAVALAAAVCFSALLLVLAPSIGIRGLSTADFRFSVVYVFFTTLNGYQVGALAGMEGFPRIARISILYLPATVVFHWTLARWFGLRGAILAQGVSALLLWLLYQAALTLEGRSHGIVIRYRGAWQERGALVRFSLPAIVSGIGGSLAIWWCNTLLVRVSGYAVLGMFTAASTLRALVVCLPALNARVISPLLNNLLAEGDVAGYRRTFWGAIICNGGFALLLALGLSVAGPQLLRVFGRDFVGSPALVTFLLAAGVTEVVATNLYQALFASRNFWWQVAVQAVWVGFLVSLSFAAIPRHGAVGLASAYLAAWCVSAVLYGILARSRHQSGFAADAKVRIEDAAA